MPKVTQSHKPMKALPYSIRKNKSKKAEQEMLVLKLVDITMLMRSRGVKFIADQLDEVVHGINEQFGMNDIKQEVIDVDDKGDDDSTDDETYVEHEDTGDDDTSVTSFVMDEENSWDTPSEDEDDSLAQNIGEGVIDELKKIPQFMAMVNFCYLHRKDPLPSDRDMQRQLGVDLYNTMQQHQIPTFENALIGLSSMNQRHCKLRPFEVNSASFFRGLFYKTAIARFFSTRDNKSNFMKKFQVSSCPVYDHMHAHTLMTLLPPLKNFPMSVRMFATPISRTLAKNAQVNALVVDTISADDTVAKSAYCSLQAMMSSTSNE